MNKEDFERLKEDIIGDIEGLIAEYDPDEINYNNESIGDKPLTKKQEKIINEIIYKLDEVKDDITTE